VRLATSVAGLFRSKEWKKERPKKNLSGFSLSSEATAEDRYGRMLGFPGIVSQWLVAANRHALVTSR
jgi:hypothetical protein